MALVEGAAAKTQLHLLLMRTLPRLTVLMNLVRILAYLAIWSVLGRVFSMRKGLRF